MFSLFLMSFVLQRSDYSVKQWGQFCDLLCFPLSLRMFFFFFSNKSLHRSLVHYMELLCLSSGVGKSLESCSIGICQLVLLQAWGALGSRRSQFSPLISNIKQHSFAHRSKSVYCPSHHQHFKNSSIKTLQTYKLVVGFLEFTISTQKMFEFQHFH